MGLPVFNRASVPLSTAVPVLNNGSTAGLAFTQTITPTVAAANPVAIGLSNSLTVSGNLSLITGNVCVNPIQGDGSQPDVAAKLFSIAVRANKGGQVDLDAEEVALLKSRLEKVMSPLVVGQAWNLLEGRDQFATLPA